VNTKLVKLAILLCLAGQTEGLDITSFFTSAAEDISKGVSEQGASVVAKMKNYIVSQVSMQLQSFRKS